MALINLHPANDVRLPVLVPAFVAPAVTSVGACRFSCVPCYESLAAPTQPLRKKVDCLWKPKW